MASLENSDPVPLLDDDDLYADMPPLDPPDRYEDMHRDEHQQILVERGSVGPGFDERQQILAEHRSEDVLLAEEELRRVGEIGDWLVNRLNRLTGWTVTANDYQRYTDLFRDSTYRMPPGRGHANTQNSSLEMELELYRSFDIPPLRPLARGTPGRESILTELRGLCAHATAFKRDRPTSEEAHWEFLGYYCAYLDLMRRVRHIQEE
ncbi:hypothetical protein DFH06DRAFT_1325025 [Mycena polygramma]|nr:hypothetical protein DFH06DRAFT_1325025 [Mycena polygramma]